MRSVSGNCSRPSQGKPLLLLTPVIILCFINVVQLVVKEHLKGSWLSLQEFV